MKRWNKRLKDKAKADGKNLISVVTRTSGIENSREQVVDDEQLEVLEQCLKRIDEMAEEPKT